MDGRKQVLSVPYFEQFWITFSRARLSQAAVISSVAVVLVLRSTAGLARSEIGLSSCSNSNRACEGDEYELRALVLFRPNISGVISRFARKCSDSLAMVALLFMHTMRMDVRGNCCLYFRRANDIRSGLPRSVSDTVF